MAVIDHLVYAVADLGAACDRIEAATGVRPALGGSHPGMGTHNALASLGDSYLEVIAPDPDQRDPDGPRPFGIDHLDGSALATFAARPSAGETIGDLVVALRSTGHDPGEPIEMSRRTPAGEELHWRLTMPMGAVDGAIPFLIDWGDTPNPSSTAPAGLTMSDLTWSVADHDAVSLAFRSQRALGLDGRIDARSDGGARRHHVTLTGPSGSVTL